MGSKGRKPPYDESNLYEHWQGKRTKMADVITATEVGMLEDVVAPLQEEYYGPALGTRHEYPATRVSRVHSSEPPEWLIEKRRLERTAFWLQREADHARAMALVETARGLQRFGTPPEDMQSQFKSRRVRGRLTVHCDCGHVGHVILGGRPSPWKLRCGQCGELQEL